MSNPAAKASSIAIACMLLGIGLAIAAFVYQSTTQIREALAQEILEQQHDVGELIQQYGNVVISIEQSLRKNDETNREALNKAVASAQNQLDAMRSTYSFERLDGAAKAHSYVTPIIADISQWTSEGIHSFDANHPFVLEQSAARLSERFPAVRAISSETSGVANELISEQTDFLERFRDSLLWLLFGFVAFASTIAALLIRQRNLLTQVAIDQESNTQRMIEAETRGRLQAESALVGSEQFLRATLNSMHADIAILDQAGIITAANTPWKTFVSANNANFSDGGIGRHFEKVFLSTAQTDNEMEGIKEVNRQVSEVLALVKEGMVHEYPCHRDDKLQWSLASMYTFHTDDGRYAVLVHEDVSERKRLEERDLRLRSELAHASRLTTAGELASGLAHELNQPLTAITHNCDAVISSVRAHADLDEELTETVSDISEQAQRAGSIIRSMRHLVRKETPDKVATDINQLVRETVRLTGPEAREKGVKVSLDLASDLPLPKIDPVQIQQVLVNLERNSVEAMWQSNSTPRELSIETRLNSEQHIQIRIIDTGPGVEPDFAEHLFTAFQTTKSEGMGLGLSISRTIVDEHGGRLWIDPDAEGVTIFTFTIPCDER